MRTWETWDISQRPNLRPTIKNWILLSRFLLQPIHKQDLIRALFSVFTCCENVIFPLNGIYFVERFHVRWYINIINYNVGLFDWLTDWLAAGVGEELDFTPAMGGQWTATIKWRPPVSRNYVAHSQRLKNTNRCSRRTSRVGYAFHECVCVWVDHIVKLLFWRSRTYNVTCTGQVLEVVPPATRPLAGRQLPWLRFHWFLHGNIVSPLKWNTKNPAHNCTRSACMGCKRTFICFVYHFNKPRLSRAGICFFVKTCRKLDSTDYNGQ